jgi:hypothetical protein
LEPGSRGRGDLEARPASGTIRPFSWERESRRRRKLIVDPDALMLERQKAEIKLKVKREDRRLASR